MEENEKINDEYIINLFIRKSGTIETNNIVKLNKHKYSQDIENYLLNRYKDSESFTETIYRIYYQIENRPVCPTCGNKVKYLGKNKYRKHCSLSCSTKDVVIQQKIKQTNLKRYGCEYASQSNIIKEKFKNTCIQKYGVSSPLLNSEIHKKTRKTKLEKYGYENFTNRNKANDTIKQKFGDIMFKTQYFKNKVKENNLLNYGVAHHSQRKEVIEKTKQTCIKKYGGNSPMYSETIKNKVKQTCLKKYGVENPYQIKEFHDKGIQFAQLPINKEKRKQTCLKKYGVDNYWKTQENIKRAHSIEVITKCNETKKKNGTLNSSKLENESYDLLKTKYPDVIHHYKDYNRYPFNCDFYIPSLDLFIECQYGQFHHGRPYLGTEEDIKDVQLLKEKAEYIHNKNNVKKSRYDAVIETWTTRDVNKRKIAKQNNLNYIEFWNINELKKWIN